jgi:plasmid maintenance system antidote protein VapI
MPIYTLDDVREALKDRKIAVVAKITGITRATIYNLINKKGDIGFKYYEKLVKYLFEDK